MADTTVRPLVEAPPTLVAKVDERSVPMRVRSCSLDVRIAGPAARTTMVLVFENPHDRVLEGELTFPVPPGSSVCGYGLDVDGEIADASLVPKRKAREVFEAEVRKRADPGLLEQIGGNRFRTRVYPLPARGTRTVRVEIETLLEPRDGEDVLVLPLRFEPPRREVTEEQRSVFTMWSELLDSVRKVEGAPDEGFHVRVEVAKGPSRPVFHDAPDLGFADRGDAWGDRDLASGPPARLAPRRAAGGREAGGPHRDLRRRDLLPGRPAARGGARAGAGTAGPGRAPLGRVAESGRGGSPTRARPRPRADAPLGIHRGRAPRAAGHGGVRRDLPDRRRRGGGRCSRRSPASPTTAVRRSVPWISPEDRPISSSSSRTASPRSGPASQVSGKPGSA
jgi:hypothetical protein